MGYKGHVGGPRGQYFLGEQAEVWGVGEVSPGSEDRPVVKTVLRIGCVPSIENRQAHREEASEHLESLHPCWLPAGLPPQTFPLSG